MKKLYIVNRPGLENYISYTFADTQEEAVQKVNAKWGDVAKYSFATEVTKEAFESPYFVIGTDQRA